MTLNTPNRRMENDHLCTLGNKELSDWMEVTNFSGNRKAFTCVRRSGPIGDGGAANDMYEAVRLFEWARGYPEHS